jgi:signal transduction histidine kinase
MPIEHTRRAARTPSTRLTGRLGLVLGLALLFCAGAPAQVASSSPETEGDGELVGGDDALTTARQNVAGANTEAEKLRALFTLVNLQRRRGDYADGLDGAHDGLARARQLGDLKLEVDFLYLLARLHWNLGDSPRALEYHQQELQLSSQLGDASTLSRTHSGLGLTLQRFGRDEEAVAHFKTGLEFAEKAGDERMMASIINSLGNYHLGKGDYEQAAGHYERALRLREKYGNRRAIADTLTNLGLVADARGEVDRALDLLRQALVTYEALQYRRYIAGAHRRIGMVLRHAGRLEEALAELRLALEVAGTISGPEILIYIHEEMAHIHEARGDFAAALASHRQLAEAKERVRGEQDRRRMDELRARYREEQRELQITLLKREQELQTAELRRRRTQNLTLTLGLIGGTCLLGAVIFSQVRRLRAERRMRTATERARLQAEEAERLKSRLLQMASHDLKVPLTALNATASLIAGSTADEVVRRLAAGIQADTARMRSLVRDFLDGAAIEAGSLQLHTTTLDLLPLVREAAEALRGVGAQKSIELRVLEPASGLPPVKADADRLRQVFDNLIGNALKFSRQGGDVVLAFGVAGAWAYVEVRDSGPGLGPSDFAHIFSPYQRLSAQPTGEGEDSTGLGLFIARELLTMQGGRLEVQSQPGHGAVFRVLLPTVAVPTG